MRKSFIILCIMLPFACLQANVKGIVLQADKTPLTGVNIYWLGTQIGTSSDANGRFELKMTESTNLLVFSFISFKNDTLAITSDKPMEVVLKEDLVLDEINVTQRRAGTTTSRFSPFQTQKITGAELCKAACCNLSESFETNPSVDVSYGDAATGIKQIRLLGLSGTYVQMLAENIPTMRGVSANYGMEYIPGSWIESIQVSKGTASVTNGYESLTGQINVEYLKPQTADRVAVNTMLNSALRTEVNANGAFDINDKLSTGILLHYRNESMEHDSNKDGFIDIPLGNEINLINRWYYKTDDFTSQFLIRGLYDERNGGQTKKWRADNQGKMPYDISIAAKRVEFFSKNGYVFDHGKGTSLGFMLSGTWHDQSGTYGDKRYDSGQCSLYANLLFQTNFTGAHKFVTGISLSDDDYRETFFNSVKTSQTPSLLRNENELTGGAFAEYTFNWHDKLIALAGVRVDYNSLYGVLFTPRVNLKYNPIEQLHFRASAGRGFRSPNIITDNSFVFASNRQIIDLRQADKMEDAWNFGISAIGYIPIGNRELQLSAEYYHTLFAEQTVVDMDADPHAVLIRNLDGEKSYAGSFQVEANCEVLRGWTWTIAHRITNVKTTYLNAEGAPTLREKPLTNRFKSLITTSYQTPLKKWQFDLTGQVNGGGRLPDTYQNTAGENQWKTEFKPFFILNAQITKYFRTWSIYLGSENLTNFTQKNPIIDSGNPFGNNFDASMAWGPIHGIKVYLGFRWALNRD